MTLEHILVNLKRDLIRTFAVVDEWFDKEHPLHCYKPVDGGWSVREVLEHISRTSHYLLLLIEKGRDKAIRKSSDEQLLERSLQNYSLMKDGFQKIAEPGSFEWHHPEHYAPTGADELPVIREKLRDQLHLCLCTLEMLPNGEGVLHRTAINVSDLGELDVYQCLYFLSLHVQRHIAQLKRTEAEFIRDGVDLNVKA